MKRYFYCLDKLHQFTLQLNLYLSIIKCHKCSRSEYLVSHGFIYKTWKDKKRKVGKRVLCSKRYGRSGCGSTEILYLSEEIPRLQYRSVHVSVFLIYLIAGVSIESAYKAATQADDPRHAYRWLDKLKRQLPNFRQYVKRPNPEPISEKPLVRSGRLKLLLPTLRSLSAMLNPNLCFQFQQTHQQRFF